MGLDFPVTIDEIINLITASDYDFYGLRVVEAHVRLGEILENSWEIIDDVPQYELPGTSVIDVDESERRVRDGIDQIRYYYGEYLILVGSDLRVGWGNDENEALLENPEVLAVWPATWWEDS